MKKSLSSTIGLTIKYFLEKAVPKISKGRKLDSKIKLKIKVLPNIFILVKYKIINILKMDIF
jgi:hypothetical protein